MSAIKPETKLEFWRQKVAMGTYMYMYMCMYVGVKITAAVLLNEASASMTRTQM